MKEVCRGSDVVARLGGEEFIVLLPETEASGALAVAEKLRQAVADARFPIEGEETVAVTASLGVAAPKSSEMSDYPAPDHMVKLADGALYEAKASGRNRVAVAAAEGHRPLRESCPQAQPS